LQEEGSATTKQSHATNHILKSLKIQHQDTGIAKISTGVQEQEVFLQY